MASLRFLNDAGQLQTKVLDAEQFVIGRAPECQLVFDEDKVSREHVRIVLESDKRFRVRDLGSRNRTYVNGVLITETLLSSGDILRIGDRVVEFLDDTSGAAEAIDAEYTTPDRSEPPHCEWAKIRAPVSLVIAQIEQLARIVGEQPLTARAEDIAASALGQIILDVQGDRGLIALRGEKKGELRPLAHRALNRPEGASLIPVSQSFVNTPLLQSVAGRYPMSASQVDMKLGFAATAVIAPLIFRGDVIGVLYVDRPASKRPFTAAHLQYILAAGAHVGAMLGESSRRVARFATREGAAWMTTIRRVQSSLAGSIQSSDTFAAVSKLYPGRARCGDFADVFDSDDLRCAMLIVDGGGHGVTGIAQACAIRSAVRTALHVTPDLLMDPGPVFDEINAQVASSNARQVVPCTYVGIDISAGKISYINAGGMPPLLMVAAGRLITLDQPALVLGVDTDYTYDSTRVDIPEIFRVVLHSDGFTEATNGAGEALGDQRLHEALLDRDSFANVEDVLKKVVATWSAHLSGSYPDDDGLVLIVGRG